MPIKVLSPLQYPSASAGTVLTADASGLLQPAAPTGGTGSSPLTRAVKTVDLSSSVTTYADVAELGFTLAAATRYAFRFAIVFRSAAITTGIGLAVNGPASPAVLAARIAIPVTLTTETLQTVSAYDTGPLSSGIDVAATDRLALIEGVIVTGAAGGVLIPRFRSEVAASAVTVRQGSMGELIT